MEPRRDHPAEGPDDEELDRKFFAPYPSPDFGLVLKRSEVRRAKREATQASLDVPDFGVAENWPPAGWRCDEFPKDRSFEAARQWANYMQFAIDNLHHWSGGPEVDACHVHVLPDILNDAHLLVRHFVRLKYRQPPSLPKEWKLPHEARMDLARLDEWLTGLIGEVTPVVPRVAAKVHIARPREFFCLKAEGLAPHSIPPLRSQLFELFAERVASGVGTEVVMHRVLILAVEGYDPPGKVSSASEAVRAAISDLNADLARWASAPDGKAWIGAVSKQGYRLNASVEWDADGPKLKAELARKSKSVHSLSTRKPGGIQDHTPNPGDRLPARSRKSKSGTADESPGMQDDGE